MNQHWLDGYTDVLPPALWTFCAKVFAQGIATGMVFVAGFWVGRLLS